MREFEGLPMHRLAAPAYATAAMIVHVLSADAQAVVVMHKACAVGTLGQREVDGTCEFAAQQGYEIVPGGVAFGWRPHREPTADCAENVVFDPPAIERQRVVVHAHATQRNGRDCGGVMDYHIETAAVLPAPPSVGSSSQAPRPPQP
jgi:hypothetical protein